MQESKNMKQRNDLILVGRIGRILKYSMSKSGNEYAYFLMEIENQTHSSEWESELQQTLHVMCFKQNVVKYMKKVGAKTGNIVIIFGFVASFQSEIKGKQVLQNSVNATEVYIVKTKQDNDKPANS